MGQAENGLFVNKKGAAYSKAMHDHKTQGI
jgi:hypothetical protein